jgi:hypothetical protein
MGRKKKLPPEPVCDVCDKPGKLESICMPGVPITLAYCEECLKINRHPWEILVGQTACAGGLENTDPYWQKMVEDTIKATNRTKEEFDKDVKEVEDQLANVKGF